MSHQAWIRGFAWIAAAFVASSSVFAANIVQIENAKAGTSDWQLAKPAPNREIEGYASLTSVNRGGTISLFVNARFADPSQATYTIEIYRIGWYGGLGGRLVHGPITRTATVQNIPAPDADGMIECNWVDPYTLTIPNNPSDPTDWASGVYLAKLTWTTGGPQSYIVFTVRDDNRLSASDYLFQSSVNTSQAYNAWGSKSLYAFNSYQNLPARKVSFNRPYDRNVGTGDFTGSMSSGWELNMIRFLEREGYDVSYMTSVDLHEKGMALLAPHKAFLSVGHDEYWSYPMKSAAHQARDAGKHLGFFSSNAIYWQIRYEPSKVNPAAANRTIVAYKEAAETGDPYWLDADHSNDKYVTTRWRDIAVPPYNVQDAIAQPENALIGVMYHGDPVYGDIVVFDATSWIYNGTAVSNGTHFTGLLGYESDAMFSNGYAPIGLQKVAESPDDFGFSHATIYTAPSGSVVFAAGSMQWSWGLDDYNVPNPRISVLDPRVQTTTRNILARFAVAPLLPPAGVQALGQVGKVVLSWSATANATNYNVYRATTSGGEGGTPYRTGIAALSFADTVPVAGVVNYYQVSSVNGVVESAKSNEASAVPLVAPPTNVAVTLVGVNLKVTWTQSATAGVTSNKVYRATATGGPYVLIATLDPTNSYTDNTVGKKTTYYYKVTALSGSVESVPSAVISATSK